ncbi:MAG: ArsA family ATPase [Alphaproteobacteria bacterium]|nr:ArsA family ATPase [Alphaproteobacteria bacterium]MCB9797361.1 ArsA family ATPase [Alphaproteobacteria bacterium]
MRSPRQALDASSLIVCVGSGGVGKTTTAATIGLQAALDGRRVLVLTIDPARRLANSLGLESFGNQETRISLPEASGELWAMMLDTQTTFDELIQRMAPDPQTADRILGNRIYRTMSDTFAGSQEYMAAEKLHDVVTSDRYDLVVLDTPPVKNALDFFEAPSRLSRFFDRRIIKWFLEPYEEQQQGKRGRGLLGGRLVVSTTTVVFRLLGYVFGKEFLEDLSEFLMLFKDMYEGFRERHETVQRLFRSASTSFFTVCAPNEPSVEVASFFLKELRERGYPRGGVVVNQVHHAVAAPLDPRELLAAEVIAAAEGLDPRTAPSLIARLGAAHSRLRQVSAAEQAIIDRVRGMLAGDEAFLVEVPWLEEQVHDLRGLKRVAGELFAK